MNKTIYAQYIGDQDDGESGKFPLFNLIDLSGKHPNNGSTLTLNGLKMLGLDNISLEGYRRDK